MSRVLLIRRRGGPGPSRYVREASILVSEPVRSADDGACQSPSVPPAWVAGLLQNLKDVGAIGVLTGWPYADTDAAARTWLERLPEDGDEWAAEACSAPRADLPGERRLMTRSALSARGAS